MGHSSIQVTVDVYGHLVPGADIAWVDRLDAKTSRQQSATPAQPDAKKACDEGEVLSPEVVDALREKDGERGRNRTYNLLIKSQLLCQLSYAPTVGNLAGRTIKNYNIWSGLFAARKGCARFVF